MGISIPECNVPCSHMTAVYTRSFLKISNLKNYCKKAKESNPRPKKSVHGSDKDTIKGCLSFGTD